MKKKNDELPLALYNVQVHTHISVLPPSLVYHGSLKRICFVIFMAGQSEFFVSRHAFRVFHCSPLYLEREHVHF